MSTVLQKVPGGRSNYGQVMGVLSLCSVIPRLPGDPGHAATFDFPVIHETLQGVSMQQLLDIDRGCVDTIVAGAQRLEQRGVRFITTNCGMYASFQREIADRLNVPFLSSALPMVPLLKSFLGASKAVGIITGHAGLLNNDHLRVSGYRLEDVVVKGMEEYPEFSRVVLNGATDLDVKKFRKDVVNAASALNNSSADIGLVVLECPNLIPFRADMQAVLQVPVFDIVSLANFFAQGYRRTVFSSPFI